MVVPDDQEIANERPTAAELVDAVGSDSTIFASEQADVDEVVEIERIEIVEVVEPGHNDFLKKRRSIIIASMAVGCFILFALSVLISSRVSCICSKPDRVSSTICEENGSLPLHFAAYTLIMSVPISYRLYDGKMMKMRFGRVRFRSYVFD